MNNWTKPRSEIAEIAAKLARKGYPVEAIAKNMADQHYLGRNRRLAAKRLIPLIIRAWGLLNGCRTEEQEKIDRQGAELRKEGWKPIFGDQAQCFWFHTELGISINQLGGGFANYSEATHYAYNSATRRQVLRN